MLSSRMQIPASAGLKIAPWKRIVLPLALAAGGGVTALAMQYEMLPRPAAFMAGIFVLATLLWITEALPLFVTSLLIIGLETVLLANPGGWMGLAYPPAEGLQFRQVFTWAADPVLVLFFGGFMLARAATKTGLDQAMSAQILKRFGSRPSFILLGVMGVTALFSMWMSNTATTAMMIALIGPMVLQLDPQNRLRKGLLLAVPFAANIGGLGTPISSPPNAVALGYLRQAGVTLHFVDWMLVAVPLMAGMLLLSWLLLARRFHPVDTNLRIEIPDRRIDSRGWFVVMIFSVTVLLWMTDWWHGLPASIVALLPVIAFTASGILERADLNQIDWGVLILIGGGIALGAGMQESGLGSAVLAWIPPAWGGVLPLVSVMVIATMILSTFISNTAAANLILPLGIAAVMSLGGGSLIRMALSIALAASLSMMLPVSTPPNAIAYVHGAFTKKEMATLGAVVGLVGGVLIILFCGVILRIWQVG